MNAPDSNHFAIAIDGPAASGKSSVAKRVAKALGYLYVNTGNMFRAVSWSVLEQGIDLKDADRITQLEQTMKLEFLVADGHVQVLVNGRQVVIDGELATVEAGPLVERHNRLARELVLAPR